MRLACVLLALLLLLSVSGGAFAAPTHGSHSILWTASPPNASLSVYSSGVLTNNVWAIVSASPWQIWGLDLATGKPRWQFGLIDEFCWSNPSGCSFQQNLAYDNVSDLLFAIQVPYQPYEQYQAFLLAISASTGMLQYNVTLLSTGWLMDVSSELVFVYSEASNYKGAGFAFETTTGRPLWETAPTQGCLSAPPGWHVSYFAKITEHVVFVQCGFDSFWAWNSSTGKLLWELTANVPGPFLAGPAFLPDGSFVAFASNNTAPGWTVCRFTSLPKFTAQWCATDFWHYLTTNIELMLSSNQFLSLMCNSTNSPESVPCSLQAVSLKDGKIEWRSELLANYTASTTYTLMLFDPVVGSDSTIYWAPMAQENVLWILTSSGTLKAAVKLAAPMIAAHVTDETLYLMNWTTLTAMKL